MKDSSEPSGDSSEGRETRCIDRLFARALFEWTLGVGFMFAVLANIARTFHSQEVIWVNDGLGWDGVSYQALYEFFSGAAGVGAPADYPYCLRVGLPWLLAAMDIDGVGFFEANVASAVLSTITVFLMTRKYVIGRPLALAGVFFITCGLYFAPIRFANFYPVYTDPIFILFMAVAVLLAVRDRLLAAIAVCVIALPFREASFYAIPLFVLLTPFRSSRPRVSLPAAIFLFLFAAWLKAILPNVTGCEPKSQLATGLAWIMLFLTEPTKVAKSISAILMTLGPLLIIMRQTHWREFLKTEGGLLAFLSVPYFAALSIAGGSDVTRLFYSFFPFYILLLAFAFNRASISASVCALSGYILTNHMLSLHDQPISETPGDDVAGFFSKFPDHGHPDIALSLALIWFFLIPVARAMEAFERHISAQRTGVAV